MPKFYQYSQRMESLLLQALKPTYTLDIAIKPDDPNSTTELDMYDDDGNIRVHIGKRDSDYGIWISRKGYDARTAPIKFLSFTGSLLTPKLKTAVIVPMTMTYDSGSNKTFEKNQYNGGSVVIQKDYLDEKISIVGFYKLKYPDGSYDRVTLQMPKDATTFITRVHDDLYMDVELEFYLTVDSVYSAVDIEFFVFTDK